MYIVKRNIGIPKYGKVLVPGFINGLQRKGQILRLLGTDRKMKFRNYEES